KVTLFPEKHTKIFFKKFLTYHQNAFHKPAWNFRAQAACHTAFHAKSAHSPGCWIYAKGYTLISHNIFPADNRIPPSPIGGSWNSSARLYSYMTLRFLPSNHK
ncbi:hypothetical protein AALB53_23640, partial [Lachnospiraceae bacterium 47-T17]